MQKFADKTALVTGAGSGIGRSVAVMLAAQGARVGVADVNEEGAAATVEAIEKSGGEAQKICFDVTNEDDVASGFAALKEAFGDIDILVNSAGIVQSNNLCGDVPTDEWRRILDINVNGTWLCMKNALAVMVAKQAGTIVNMSSVFGLRTCAGQTAYVASKHALVGLTKNAALEYAPMGIRVNAVCPGGIDTPMIDGQLAGLTGEAFDAAKQGMADFHPMKRLGTPEDIANAAIFLCSEDASFVTGATLSADGGWAAN